MRQGVILQFAKYIVFCFFPKMFFCDNFLEAILQVFVEKEIFLVLLNIQKLENQTANQKLRVKKKPVYIFVFVSGIFLFW